MKLYLQSDACIDDPDRGQQCTPMREPSKRPRSLSRRGFSLLEIVVTISILAILIAIVIPAIQQARAVARRTECANRLKQIGVAIQSYESTHRHLPFGNKNGFSVLVQILPQLEQGSLYEQLDVEQFPYLTNSEEILRMNRPDFYLCPADVSPRGLRKAGTSYVNSFGTGYFGQPDSASLLSVVADNGPFSRTLGESFTTARIRDGLSHTAFFSEVAGYPPSQVGAVTRIPTRPATVQDWQQLVSDC
ncbi:MAG: DUF1559 domain-containing protein, partial [Planctomycetaceae bacterium]